MTLKSAKLEGDKLTFDVTVLEGDLAGADGPASVFIDRFALWRFPRRRLRGWRLPRRRLCGRRFPPRRCCCSRRLPRRRRRRTGRRRRLCGPRRLVIAGSAYGGAALGAAALTGAAVGAAAAAPYYGAAVAPYGAACGSLPLSALLLTPICSAEDQAVYDLVQESVDRPDVASRVSTRRIIRT